MVLVAVDAAAAALGLSAGLPLADARARVPGLDVTAADPVADRALLERLADLCDRYTPLVGLDPPDGLLLDVAGCAHLFGGEAALAADLAGRLGRLGFCAAVAVAGSAAAAAALARARGSALPPAVVPPGGEALALAHLPVAALRLDAAVAAGLARLGLDSVGTVAAQPRGPLAKRFGRGLLQRLDEALGRVEAPISPRRPVPALVVERRFADPVTDTALLAGAVEGLVGVLAARLEARGEGVRRLALTLFRADGTPLAASVGTSRPLRAPARLAELLAPGLERLGELDPADGGFDLARLAVVEAAPLAVAQIGLAGRGGDAEDLARLVDRLSVRLGPRAVTRLVPGDAHLPEAACLAVPALGHTCAWRAGRPAGAFDWDGAFDGAGDRAGATDAAAAGLAAEGDWSGEPGPQPDEPPARPLRLLARPEPVEVVAAVPDGPPLRFRWRRALYEVAAAEGPERLAAEWWRGEAPTRDYFRVEDAVGRRFWLYRAGLFGRETDRPAWYLHGLFG